MLKQNNREPYEDYIFDSDSKDIDYSDKYFLRLVAKKRRFEHVDFKYSIFDTSYMRNCVFDSCDFTGCRFVSVNFYGSSFNGCKFDYATFERTIIDSDILDVGCPSWENLKLKFARSLRTNFQQIGDTKGANKAIKVELSATEVYLSKAWHSNESYYRKKYEGWKRLGMFIEWLAFKILDMIWGNGESTLKLVRTAIMLLVLMACIDYFSINHYAVSFFDTLAKMPAIFLGIVMPNNYHELYLSAIAFTRLAITGFFMSIIIKRFNRR